MGGVVAITFEDAEQASKVREAMRGLEKQGLLSLDDAAVIVRDEQGKFRVRGQADRGVKTGALVGGAIGLLLTTIFAPLGGIVLGALAGAGVGATTGIGIDGQFIQDIKESLPNNSSAIILYKRDWDPAAMRAALEPFHGKVFHSSLDTDADEQLRRALEK